MEFSTKLGKPEFVRVPYTEADGVGLFLPRKRSEGRSEVVEVMIMLRSDGMDVLEHDIPWDAFRIEVSWDAHFMYSGASWIS